MHIGVLLSEELGHIHLKEHNPAEYARSQDGTNTLIQLRNVKVQRMTTVQCMLRVT